MKKIAISQSNYIPWKGYFDLINSVDEFVLYDDMQYTKRDWRNRNKIKTPAGLQWLTIPVEVKGKYFQKISETKISEQNWNAEHWKAIKHNYSKAPCFKQFAPVFEELYMTASESYLSQINYKFIQAICSILNIATPIFFSSKYDLRGDKSERLLNICLDASASVYYSGPAAKDYLDTALFEANHIEVVWFDYSGYKEYPQLYPPFEHSVSVLDLILNVGDEADKFMKSFSYAATS